MSSGRRSTLQVHERGGAGACREFVALRRRASTACSRAERGAWPGEDARRGQGASACALVAAAAAARASSAWASTPRAARHLHAEASRRLQACAGIERCDWWHASCSPFGRRQSPRPLLLHRRATALHHLGDVRRASRAPGAACAIAAGAALRAGTRRSSSAVERAPLRAARTSSARDRALGGRAASSTRPPSALIATRARARSIARSSRRDSRSPPRPSRGTRARTRGDAPVRRRATRRVVARSSKSSDSFGHAHAMADDRWPLAHGREDPTRWPARAIRPPRSGRGASRSSAAWYGVGAASTATSRAGRSSKRLLDDGHGDYGGLRRRRADDARGSSSASRSPVRAGRGFQVYRASRIHHDAAAEGERSRRRSARAGARREHRVDVARGLAHGARVGRQQAGLGHAAVRRAVHVGDARVLVRRPSIWWSFVTLTTVGYGDVELRHRGDRDNHRVFTIFFGTARRSRRLGDRQPRPRRRARWPRPQGGWRCSRCSSAHRVDGPRSRRQALAARTST